MCLIVPMGFYFFDLKWCFLFSCWFVCWFPGSPAGKESTCQAGDLGWEDPLEKGTATHSSILAGRIPWPWVLRLQWAGHGWATFTFHFPLFNKYLSFVCQSAFSWSLRSNSEQLNFLLPELRRGITLIEVDMMKEKLWGKACDAVRPFYLRNLFLGWGGMLKFL